MAVYVSSHMGIREKGYAETVEAGRQTVYIQVYMAHLDAREPYGIAIDKDKKLGTAEHCPHQPAPVLVAVSPSAYHAADGRAEYIQKLGQHIHAHQGHIEPYPVEVGGYKVVCGGQHYRKRGHGQARQ